MRTKAHLLTAALACPLVAAPQHEILADISAAQGQGGVEYGLAKLGNLWVFRGRSAAEGEELFVCSGPSYAVSVLRDVRPGPAGSSPEHLTVVGNKLFFFADDGAHGLELWVSDGTTAGTALVADVRPGPNPGVVIDQYGRAPLVSVGGTVFFVADDGVNGAELWKSDGSSAGTMLVVDVAPGSASAGIRDMASNGAHLFFNSNVGAGNLWRSDGTAAGTMPLGTFYAPPYALTAVGATVFFVAAGNTAEGYELWKTDGTLAGTTLVRDIFPGPWNSSSYPGGLTPLGNTLFFEADDGTHGHEPWISDGTTAGTVMVKDIAPGSASSVPGYYRQRHLVVGGRVVFAADDGTAGSEPWISDGTTAGTVLLRDVRPGADSSITFTGFNLWRGSQAGAGRGFFAADDGIAGTELWATDGTTAGTARVADLVPGPVGSKPARILVDASGMAMVVADSAAGGALWRAVATSATLVTTAVSRAPRWNSGSDPRDFTVLGGNLLFAANEPGSGNELWRTDGTAAGTAMVRDIRPGPGHGFELGDPQYYAPGAFAGARLGDHVLFAGYDALLALGLWKSDGSAAGTVKLRALDKTLGGLGYVILGASYRDVLFFSAYAAGQGWSLWASDGTAPNTARLHSVGTNDPRNMNPVVRLGQRILWFVSGGWAAGGISLYGVNPTTGARTRIAWIPGSYYATPLASARLGNRLLFLVPTSGGAALWETDGVTASSLVPSLGGGTRRGMVRLGDHVYFMAATAGTGAELWRSDGTAAGTVAVADLVPGPTSSSPRAFAVAGDRMFFAADDGPNVALWISDGTPGGTQRVVPLPGSGHAAPDILHMTAVGSRKVYFATLYGATFGSELWHSDGTATGTALVADLYPGTAGGAPYGLTAHRGRLVFAADDSWRGFEPWVLSPGATAMPYGLGCAASGFEPELAATDPVLGTSLRFSLRDAVANAAGVALFGAPSFPEVQLGLGCSLAVQITGSIPIGFTTDAAGRFASPPLAVPPDTGLIGQQLALQAVVGPTANLPLPIDFSNGVLLTFGQ